MRLQWSSGFRLGWVAAVAVVTLGVTAAGRAAPQRPTPQTLQRLEAARLQLDAAYRNAPAGKEGVLSVDRALAVYNAARKAAFGPDLSTSSAAGSFDGTIPEVEANNTAATAQSLDAALLQEGSAVVVGEIRAAGDLDFFSFTAPAGARVWAYVDTGGTQLPGASSTDSVLTLFNTDQTTQIETDDDDGSGNGRDGTLESNASSVIAGRTLSSTGTYYLRVAEFNNDQIMAPYRLYVVLTTTSSNESEANDTTLTADTLLPVGSQVGLVNGAAAGADVDLYRLALQAGDVLTLQIDEDPGRDGNSHTELALLNPAGAPLLTVSGFGNSGGVGGQAFSWRAVTSGIYFARVRQASSVPASDYALLATVHIRTVGAAPSVINGVLGSGSADYPAISGTQIGRIFRDAAPSNCEAGPKPFPGGNGDGTTPHNFDAYVFKNRSGQDACVALTLTAYDSASIHSCLYSTFDPGNLQPGYLGDSGSSAIAGTPRQYSVKVAAGAVFVVTVFDASVTPGKPYTLSVTGDFRSSLVGCPANLTVRNDPNLAGAVVNFNAPGTTDPSLGPVVCTPASGSFFPVGNTVVTCRDSIGTTCSFTVTVQDVQAPALGCPSSLTAELDQPGGAVVNYAVGASDNVGVTFLNCTPPPGSVFPLGLTIVTCTAKDAAGNTTTCTFPVTVKDSVAPQITCPNGLTLNQDRPTGALVTYSASATDNSGTVSLTTSPSSNTVFPLGPTVVTCTATDGSGNTTVRTFLVTVKDTQAPSVTCPASVTAVQDLSGGAVVNYNMSASDNAGSVNLTCTPPSGSFFPVGTTTVSCVAVDTSGNVSTCSFPVTVTAPASTNGVTVAGNGTIATGSPSAKFKITASVSATGVRKLTFTYTHAKAQRNLIGTSVSAIVRSGNLVRIYGKLRNGLSAEQEFLLEVRDVAKPGAGKDTFRLDVLGGAQVGQTVIATGDIKITP